MDKTYRQSRRWFETKFKKMHRDAYTSWTSVANFHAMTGGVLDGHVYAEDELEIMAYRLFDPITGLVSAGPKIGEWHDVMDKIVGVCVGPNGGLTACPDDPDAYGMRRLLSARQETLLLLFTILMLHETAYKGVVDFVYDCSGETEFGKLETKKRAEYLAKQGFDVRPAADHFLRNGIAHSSFLIDDDGGVLVAGALDEPPFAGYDPKSMPRPPGTKYYERKKLINAFGNLLSLAGDAIVGVVYWFHVNHGVRRLFDDRFFGSPARDAVREDALAEMHKHPGMRGWKSVLAEFERKLPRQ